MKNENKYHFNLLKKLVETTFLENNKASDSIEKWKGDEIASFQEDLFAKVKARVSEKWFYTYFKNTPDKLPRVDMLNLLSEYVGQRNWNTFKTNHNAKSSESNRTKRRSLYLLLVLILFGLIWFGVDTKNKFSFCFVDELLGQPIVNVPLDIKVLSENESPISFKTDSLGCFNYVTSADYIRFVIKSPYHKTDTIIRHIENHTGSIPLATDDYSLMLKYYTDGNVTDWKQHKERLKNLIADNAIIYQLYPHNIGVEVFTKDDFVRILTIPTSRLKRVKVIDKTIENGKIVKLKFIVL